MATQRSKSSVRERIIETAERLFYTDGVRAVGIDRIIAEAKVAKMSLYNHFASKDDLILAVLEYREQKFDAMLEASIRRHSAQGLGSLDAFFAALKDWFESPDFRGCMFINSHAELADAEHPAARFAARHKERFRETLHKTVEDAVSPQVAAVTAPAIALLVEGSIVSSAMQRSSQPAEMVQEATRALIAHAQQS